MVRWRGRGILAGLVVVGTLGVPGVAATESASASTGTPWTITHESIQPLVPARVLDTRDGTGAAAAPVAAGEAGVIELDVTGVGGVPDTGVGAVVLNVTATQPTRTSYVTVWPTGSSRPLASSLNMVGGQTIGNLVLARVGDGGRISLYNNSGTTHLVADVMGWASATAQLEPIVPTRLLDTRTGNGAAVAKVGPGDSIRVPIAGRGGLPASGISAVWLNLTSVEPTRTSYVTVWPGDQPRPTAANLNMVAGEVAGNLVLAKVAPDGTIDLFNNAGDTHLVADVTAWVPDGTPLVPLVPARMLDTRDGTGGVPVGKVAARSTISLPVAGVGDIPDEGVAAVVLSVTATAPTRTSYVTVWPSGEDRPLAANLNMAAGQTINKLVLAKVGPDGYVELYNNDGSTHLVADAVGWIADAEGQTTGVPHATTVIPDADDVVGEELDGDVTTVVLAAGAPVPGVGDELFVPPVANAPEGVLGTVTGTAAGTGGTTVVETVPAALEDAFADFESTFSGPSAPLAEELFASESIEPSGPQESASAGDASFFSGWRVNLLKTDGGLSCSAGSPFTDVHDVGMTFENTFVDWHFSLGDRSAFFVMTTTPTLSGSISSAANAACSYKFELPFTWPIPGTPFFIDVSVKATLTISAAAELEASAGAAVTIGFSYDDGDATNLSDIAFVGSASAGGTFTLTLSDTIALGVKLAKRIGVEVGFGVALTAEAEATTTGGTCLTVDLAPIVTVTATADLWLKSWSISVAKFEGPPAELYRSDACGAQWTGSLTLTTGEFGPTVDAVVTIGEDGFTWSGQYLDVDGPSWHGPAHPCGEGTYTIITMAGYERGGDGAVGDPAPVENQAITDLPSHPYGTYGDVYDPPAPYVADPFWFGPEYTQVPPGTYVLDASLSVAADHWNGCAWMTTVIDISDTYQCWAMGGVAPPASSPLVGSDTGGSAINRSWTLTWGGPSTPPNGPTPTFCGFS